MLVKIKKAEFKKEVNTRFGTRYSFLVVYVDTTDKEGKEHTAFYLAMAKDQKNIEAGKEVEVIEEYKTVENNGEKFNYTNIKLATSKRNSNFGKALDREKARYSGFAVSYVKDLIIAGKVDLNDFDKEAWHLHKLMVEMDKSLEQ